MVSFILFIGVLDLYCINWAVGLALNQKASTKVDVQRRTVDRVAFYTSFALVVALHGALYLSVRRDLDLHILALAVALYFGVLFVGGVYVYAGRAIFLRLPLLRLCGGFRSIQKYEATVRASQEEQRHVSRREFILLTIIGVPSCICVFLVLSLLFLIDTTISLKSERDQLLKMQSDYYQGEWEMNGNLKR